MLSFDAQPAGVQQFPPGLLAINFTSSCVDEYIYITCILYSLLIFSVSREKSFADVRLALNTKTTTFCQRKGQLKYSRHPAIKNLDPFLKPNQNLSMSCALSNWKASICEQKRSL